MDEGYVACVPKDVCMCGRYVCLYVYKDGEFVGVQSELCLRVCGGTWTTTKRVVRRVEAGSL